MSVTAVPDPAPLLSTRGLTRTFGGVAAVSNVDIDVRPGRLHAVIGPNGAGKTTLFNLLTGVLSPSRGEILFDGEPVTRVSVSGRVKRGLARSYQNTNIFPRMTVRQNIRAAAYRAHSVGWRSFFGRPESVDAADAKAEQILRDLDVEQHADMVAQNLPYGAQRLVDIGLALACEPKLLLLDEPTSGLSSGELDQASAFIGSLKASHSILLIEHNMDLVLRLADVITVLNFGEVLAEGDAAEISANQAVQEAYFGKGFGRAARQ
ncbi:MAG TPA: ABC transporter ATP-binding protein [Paracoccaceae bacterium]|nr:ABC transporter ATP-binding protein [Paracoccaceae bacterium]